MTADPAQSLTLSPYSAGMNRYVDDEAVRRIVRATKLPLRPNVNFPSFSSQLNNTLRFTMVRMLFLPYSKAEFRKLEKAFLAYEKLSKELQTADPFPPLTPREWHLKALKWFAELNTVYNTRGKGGPSKSLIVQYFYPRAIGLYYAGFGVKPVSTTNEKDTLLDGPTARFLNATFEEMENSIDSFGFDDAYTTDQVPKLRRFKTTPSALRKNIHKAMRMLEAQPDELQCQLLGIDPEEASQWPRRPVWRIYAEYFEKFILNT